MPRTNVLKIFRNNQLFATHEAALENIQSKAATLGDGELWVATYGTSPNAKSILAIKRTWGVTIFDLEEITDSIADNSYRYKITTVDNPSNTSAAEYKIQEQLGGGSWADVTGSTTIVVPKDNAFVTAQLGHVGATVNQSTGVITDGNGEDALLIEYKNGSGVYTIVAVPVGAFLKEAEFKDGLSVNNNGEVSAKLGQGLEFGSESNENKSINVKIDTTNSEKDSQTTPVDFITVGANGVKIQGIKDEIDRRTADKLETSDVEEMLEEYLQEVEAGNGIDVSAMANNAQTVSVKLNTTLTDNALSVDSDGLYFSKTIDCGSY